MDPVSLLVVDDHESIRSLLTTVLTQAGYAVATASDGKEALESIHDQPPALVLMDLMMPKMDGWEATRRLKTAPDTGDIPVIAVTAEDHRRSTERLREAGFSAYLPKPFQLKQAVQAVELCLQGAAAGESWIDLPPPELPARRRR